MFVPLEDAAKQEQQRRYSLPVATAVERPLPSLARSRWSMAIAAVMQVQLMRRLAATLTSRRSSPADRLHAAVRLKMQAATWGGLLARCPHKELLRLHLGRRRRGQFVTLAQRLETELYLTGAHAWDMCSPAKLGEHACIFTPLLAVLLLGIFLFMAGQYAYFVAFNAAAAAAAAAPTPSASAGSPTAPPCAGCDEQWITSATHADALVDWFFHSGRAEAQFSFDFLLAWGGRTGPALVAPGGTYRWFSSALIHANTRHIAGNLLLLLALGIPLEVRYGAVRIAAVFLIATAGGALLSAAVENPCTQVVGASAGICGLLGLFAVDLLASYRTLRRPLLRALCTLLALAIFLYITLGQGHVSAYSHMGGLLCGLLPALLILPTLPSERWEAALPLAGGLALVIYFAALPAWLYTFRLLPGPLAARCGTQG